MLMPGQILIFFLCHTRLEGVWPNKGYKGGLWYNRFHKTLHRVADMTNCRSLDFQQSEDPDRQISNHKKIKILPLSHVVQSSAFDFKSTTKINLTLKKIKKIIKIENNY